MHDEQDLPAPRMSADTLKRMVGEGECAVREMSKNEKLKAILGEKVSFAPENSPGKTRIVGTVISININLAAVVENAEMCGYRSKEKDLRVQVDGTNELFHLNLDQVRHTRTTRAHAYVETDGELHWYVTTPPLSCKLQRAPEFDLEKVLL